MKIEDLAGCPCEKHSKSHPLLTPITHKKLLQSIAEQEYIVLFDPPADGNCQFSVVAYALKNIEIFRSSVKLRNEVINYLNTDNILPNGFPMELFAGIL